MMTIDGLISMHKATTEVIDELQAIDPADSGDMTLAIVMLRKSLVTLATVQRDLLAAALGK